MRRMSKADRLQIEVARDEIMKLAGLIQEKHSALSGALDALIHEHLNPLNEAIAEYNEQIEEHNGLIDGVIEEIDTYVGERSERWQESESAETYAAWREALQQAQMEPVDPLDPPEIDEIDLASLDEFPQTEPGQD